MSGMFLFNNMPRYLVIDGKRKSIFGGRWQREYNSYCYAECNDTVFTVCFVGLAGRKSYFSFDQNSDVKTLTVKDSAGKDAELKYIDGMVYAYRQGYPVKVFVVDGGYSISYKGYKMLIHITVEPAFSYDGKDYFYTDVSYKNTRRY